LITSSSGLSVANVRRRYPIGDCLRIQGPATIRAEATEAGPHDYLPPNLMERLERLAYGHHAISRNRAPLETYTTLPTEAGTLVRATDQFVRWFNACYGTADDRVPTPRTEAAVSAGEQGPDEHKPKHWRKNRMKTTE